jgi:hypothetical protein
MRRQFSGRTQFTINSIIALLAAGGGIIALLNYLRPAKAELKPLTVNGWVWPQQVRPGEEVTITVRPLAPNEDVIPGTEVVIANFSSYDDGDGSWEDESRAGSPILLAPTVCALRLLRAMAGQRRRSPCL